ncbi:MAG TPA: gamma carbonic anhydrase family protein [Mycobacteriales bacterium]|nr:gamma carbonic anhydrase family protein [Mycobacteriales bacterium]
MAIYALGDLVPDIHPEAFVHPDATVIGAVRIGAEASVWPQAVLRGDSGGIVVGERTSVQDGAVLHCTERFHTTVGADCVIGHCVHLEGCTIEPGTLVGSNSVVLHGAVVGSGALVGAGAVVSNGRRVPALAMALGVPARIRADAVPPNAFTDSVAWYVANARRYRDELRRLGG